MRAVIYLAAYERKTEVNLMLLQYTKEKRKGILCYCSVRKKNGRENLMLLKLTGETRKEDLISYEPTDVILYEPADIMIHIQGKGIVVREKSVVAFQKSDNKIIAIGTEAYGMADKNMEDLVVISPLRQGIVADFTVAVKLFSYLLKKALGKKPIFKKPAVAVCVPKGITAVELVALQDVLMIAGAKELIVTDHPMEEFLREFPEKSPKEYKKFKITIGITKDEPELYIKERMREIQEYAGREQISQEKVCELLQGLKGN